MIVQRLQLIDASSISEISLKQSMSTLVSLPSELSGIYISVFKINLGLFYCIIVISKTIILVHPYWYHLFYFLNFNSVVLIFSLVSIVYVVLGLFVVSVQVVVKMFYRLLDLLHVLFLFCDQKFHWRNRYRHITNIFFSNKV